MLSVGRSTGSKAPLNISRAKTQKAFSADVRSIGIASNPLNRRAVSIETNGRIAE
jgi:hypothetical protein